MDEKIINKIGWIASLVTISMYLSYIDQIRLNISGQKGSVIVPIITTFTGIAWTSYALLKKKRDWPIAACNIPAIIFGIITFITAII